MGSTPHRKGKASTKGLHRLHVGVTHFAHIAMPFNPPPLTRALSSPGRRGMRAFAPYYFTAVAKSTGMDALKRVAPDALPGGMVAPA